MVPHRKHSRSAFTLVELLVVLGVMAIFVGVFATALRPGSPTVAVEGAQSQLASLLTQTRGVAVLKGSEARLIINNNPGNRDRYLRFAGIVFDEDGDPTTEDWKPATDGITFPQGVYAYTGLPANMLTDDFTYISNSPEEYAYIEFRPNGTVSPIGGNSPIVALSSGDPNISSTGEFDTGEPISRNENNIRGAIVRQYGSFVLLNDSTAFSSGD